MTTPSRPIPREEAAARASVAVAVAVSVCFTLAGCSVSRPVLRPADRVPTTTTTITTAPTSITTTASTTTTAPAGRPTASTATTGAAPTTGAPSSDDAPSFVATARDGRAAVAVYEQPGDTEADRTVANPGDYGQAQVFLVLDREPGWLRVALPVRPNGSTGWLREADVTVTQHRYRIVVSLSRHRFEVFDAGRRILDAPAGIGTSDTPTPGGTYYTWVLIDPSNSGYGAYAYGLSGFSDALDTFAGGDGRLGIHGTTDETSVGRDVSHGCIRVTDAVITRLVHDVGLPLGVPVTVTR